MAEPSATAGGPAAGAGDARLDPPGPIDLRPCKVAVARLWPPGNPLREALLAEPDSLPWSEGVAKLETYLRLAWASRTPPAG